MWGRYWQLKDVLCPRHSSLAARMKLYNLSLRRTALWGSGSWRLRVAEARSLNTAEMEIVRRIVGIPRKKDEPWVKFYQRSMRLARAIVWKYLGGQHASVAWCYHWRWAGHLARYADNF